MQAAEGVQLALGYCDDVEFSAEDATRSDVEFLIQVITAAVAAGATTINIPDTVGYVLPAEIERLFSTLLDRVPGLSDCVLSAHCHDDLGSWRSRTRWRRSTPAPARSSARSTASASGLETLPWRRS